MNQALKWKLIAGFILVFVAGGISGAFLGGLYAKNLFFGFHDPEQIAARMKGRLRADLSLTPEQVAKISPIIDNAAIQLREIRRDTARRVHETIAKAHQDMSADLTDEQRQKLQQIEERHRRSRHGHFPHEPSESPSASP